MEGLLGKISMMSDHGHHKASIPETQVIINNTNTNNNDSTAAVGGAGAGAKSKALSHGHDHGIDTTHNGWSHDVWANTSSGGGGYGGWSVGGCISFGGGH